MVSPSSVIRSQACPVDLEDLEVAEMVSPSSVIRSQACPVDLEDLEVTETEPASAWTGSKKPKIQSTPKSWQDDIESWDDEKLGKAIDVLRDELRVWTQEPWAQYLSDDDDHELNEEKQKALNQLTIAEFGDLDIDPYTHHKLEDDQQFSQFWEMLSSETELIEKYITGKSCERQRIENMLLYHALKIAETLPSVYKTTIISRFREFMRGVEGDYTHAGFLTNMWDLIAKPDANRYCVVLSIAKQMEFKDALKHVFDEGKYRSIFQWGTEFDSNLSQIEQIYKPHLDRIVERTLVNKSRDDVHQLVMDTIVENFWKPRRYYDYVRKKLRIAEEIRLIPKQPPHRLYSPASVLKIACFAET